MMPAGNRCTATARSGARCSARTRAAAPCASARSPAVSEASTAIAQALFVTTKTVEMHLSRAYRKLGIASRDQLRDALAD